MAVPESDDTNLPSSNSQPATQLSRPSWETAPRPAVAPRQAPAAQPALPRPSAVPAEVSASPYYATPAARPAYAPIPAAPTAYAASAYAPEPDMDVRYDLAGNPIPSSASAVSPTLAPPFGYSAGNTAPAVWPPPASGAPQQYGGPQYGGPQYGAQAYRNNSGEQSHLPPEIEKLHWNWGAFFFPILWTKKHGLTTIAAMLTGGLIFLRVLRYIAAAISPAVFLGICILYGLSYFALQIFCGFNGHKIGWRNRHFPGGTEEYFKVQTAWMWWGFGVNVLLGPFLAFGIFVLVVAATLGGATHHHHYRPYSNGDGTSGYSRYGNSGTYGGSNNYGSGGNNYSSGGNSYGNGSSGSSGSDTSSSAGQ